MRRVVRPVVAILLLVGVGWAAADRGGGSSSHGGPICALILAADDPARRDHLAALAPETPTPVDPRVLHFEAPAQPTVALRTADLLVDAPKTSPPA